MPTLSSRPSPPSTGVPSQQDVLDAAQPSINILSWLSQRMHFPDDRPATIRAGIDVLEEALDCMQLLDYAVVPMPSGARHLAYDVAVKPLDVGAFVFFQIQFNIV